jgi:hypothetical protein
VEPALAGAAQAGEAADRQRARGRGGPAAVQDRGPADAGARARLGRRFTRRRRRQPRRGGARRAAAVWLRSRLGADRGAGQPGRGRRRRRHRG